MKRLQIKITGKKRNPAMNWVRQVQIMLRQKNENTTFFQHFQLWLYEFLYLHNYFIILIMALNKMKRENNSLRAMDQRPDYKIPSNKYLYSFFFLFTLRNFILCMFYDCEEIVLCFFLIFFTIAPCDRRLFHSISPRAPPQYCLVLFLLISYNSVRSINRFVPLFVPVPDIHRFVGVSMMKKKVLKKKTCRQHHRCVDANTKKPNSANWKYKWKQQNNSCSVCIYFCYHYSGVCLCAGDAHCSVQRNETKRKKQKQKKTILCVLICTHRWK